MSIAAIHPVVITAKLAVFGMHRGSAARSGLQPGAGIAISCLHRRAPIHAIRVLGGDRTARALPPLAKADHPDGVSVAAQDGPVTYALFGGGEAA